MLTGKLNRVFNSIISRVRHKLTAGHELPFGIRAKRIAHAAMTSCNAHAAAHGFANGPALILADLAHGPDRHN